MPDRSPNKITLRFAMRDPNVRAGRFEDMSAQVATVVLKALDDAIAEIDAGGDSAPIDDMRPKEDGLRYVSAEPSDPICFDSRGWWFFEETWVNCRGPFKDEAEARSRLREYARTL